MRLTVYGTHSEFTVDGMKGRITGTILFCLGVPVVQFNVQSVFVVFFDKPRIGYKGGLLRRSGNRALHLRNPRWNSLWPRKSILPHELPWKWLNMALRLQGHYLRADQLLTR